MANRKIYYADLIENSGEIIRESTLIDKNYSYAKCPVFNHKSNRTFYITSPFDFNLELNRNKQIISCSHPERVFFKESDRNSPKFVMQLNFPRFLFWTNDKNIWFEFNDHPLTSYKNNFVAIGGWFNLSNWTRSMSFALTLVDETKPLIIKKGDFLCRISFHSPNLNDGIILKHVTDKNKIDEMVLKMHKTMQFETNLIKTLFSNTFPKKCPFRFLFKK